MGVLVGVTTAGEYIGTGDSLTGPGEGIPSGDDAQARMKNTKASKASRHCTRMVSPHRNEVFDLLKGGRPNPGDILYRLDGRKGAIGFAVFNDPLRYHWTDTG